MQHAPKFPLALYSKPSYTCSTLTKTLNVGFTGNMEANWKIFTDCKSDAAAKKVATKFFVLVNSEPLSVIVEPYHKGGYVVTATVELEASAWSQSVLFALQKAQTVGKAWTISGNIADELDAWSNEALVPGIQSLHLLVLRM
jgi:hypothetical protein